MSDFENAINGSWEEQIEVRSRQAGQDILNRMFEPTPIFASLSIGDTVRLLRSELTGVTPIGAIGTIVDIDTEGSMYEKGRPYEVRFELAGYKIPLDGVFPPHIVERIKESAPQVEYLQSWSTYFGINDLEVIGSSLGFWFYIVRSEGNKYVLYAFAPFPDDTSVIDDLAAYIGARVAETVIREAQRNLDLAMILLKLDNSRLCWI